MGIRDGDMTERNFMRGYKTRQKAVRFYHPEPYQGRITLFRATEIEPVILI